MHWCDFLEVSISPASGVPGTHLDLSVILANDVEVALSVEDIAVKFPWTFAAERLGPMMVPGFGSNTKILPAALPSSPGSAVIAISVTAEMRGDLSADVCGPFVRSFTLVGQGRTGGSGGQGGGPTWAVAPLRAVASWWPFVPLLMGAVIVVASVAMALRRRLWRSR